MARNFDETNDSSDGAFIEVRFKDILSPEHPAHYIKQFIKGIDVSPFETKYKVGPGQKGRAPKGITTMLGVILYAIFSRIYSARHIDYATYNYSDFWIFTHKKRISHDKISDFINMHKEDLKLIFSETIALAEKNKLLSFEVLYQDGFHVKANASKKRNRTKKKLKIKKKKIEARVEEILNELQESSKEDESISKEKIKLEKDLRKIRQLEEELNQKIKTRGFTRLPKEQQKLEENLQINSTDKDAELTKMKKGGYENAYTKINAVDGKADIVVASDVDGHYDESHKTRKLAKEANKNVNGMGEYKKVCADSNFNTLGSCMGLEVEGIKLISPTKQHESERKNPEKNKNKIKFEYKKKGNCVVCSEGNKLVFQSQSAKVRFGNRIIKFSNKEGCKYCKRKGECTKQDYKEYSMDARSPLQQRAYNRYKSKEGQKLYKKRMHIAEVFQGDLKMNGNFNQLLRRGIEKAKTDLMLHDIIWNLRRIINATRGKIIWST